MIFYDLMHTLMEDYVDDLLEKYLTHKDHLKVLDKFFKRLEEYKVCLNPKKCVFGMTSGKLLGYIVSRRGIKVDPTKVKEILDMPPPKGISELRTLHGRLRAICQFIAQLVDKFQPFQYLLCKGIPFVWTDKCQTTFEQIEDYLLTPPVLMPPIEGKALILYISATTAALGALLA